MEVHERRILLSSRVTLIKNWNESIKLEGLVFLKDPKVQELIKALLDGTIERLEPAYSIEKGQHFPLLEEHLDLSSEETNDLLERLVMTGVLTEKTTGTILKCPTCESTVLRPINTCPRCGSTNYERGTLVEHYICGNVGFDQHFKQGSDYICTRCGELLTLKALGRNWIIPGKWHRCRDCHLFFEIQRTQPLAVCVLCGHNFDIREAVLEEAKTYILDPLVLEDLMSATGVTEPLLKMLEKEGAKTEMPARIIGKSGMLHHFSFAFTKERDPEAFVGAGDIVIRAAPITGNEFFNHLSKFLDIEATQRFFVVAGAKLDDDARSLAESYVTWRGPIVKVVEEQNLTKAVQKLIKAIQSALLEEPERKESELEVLESMLQKMKGDKVK